MTNNFSFEHSHKCDVTERPTHLQTSAEAVIVWNRNPDVRLDPYSNTHSLTANISEDMNSEC